MDIREFTDKVRTCQIQLYKIAFSITGSHADAEDAVSEAVLKAWEKRETLRNSEYFTTWLIRILINICRAELRRRSSHPSVPYDETLKMHVTNRYPSDDGRKLTSIMLKLDEKYRLPLTMHYVLGMSIADTAKSLSLAEGVVRWRIRKGKDMVAEALRSEEDQ